MTARLRALGAATFAAALCLLAPASPAHAAAADGAHGSSSASQGPLIDPESDDALLNLLMEDGIQYTTSSTVDDAESYGGADSTLVIDGDETGLDPEQVQQLAHGRWGRIIVLSVDQNVLDALAPGVVAEGPGADSGGSSPVDPGCDQTDANSAGSVLMPSGSEVYQVSPTAGAEATASATAGPSGSSTPQITDVTGCYTVSGSGGPAMVSLRNATTGGDVIVLGFTDFVENQYLAQQGDAALALRLFGAHGTLVWLATSFTEDQNLTGCQGASCGGDGSATSGPGGSGGGAGGGGGLGGGGSGGQGGNGGGSARSVTLAQLIPHWIWWMLLQLVVAAVALAYWRSRRLGRLVSEQLPVKVRAAETVEGHANLYRRAAAHGRAAGLLRSAAARRIAPLLGLPAGPAGRAPATLVDPLAARLGRPAEQVRAILAGAAPMTEAELVQLTDQLDRLEQEVRSP